MYSALREKQFWCARKGEAWLCSPGRCVSWGSFVLAQVNSCGKTRDKKKKSWLFLK